jgi:hypothetical protein
MFICALDRSSDSLRLVLTVQGEDRVPRLLEGRRIPWPVSPSSLQATFQELVDIYGVQVNVAVCNSADPLSSELLEALQDVVGRVEWVEQGHLNEVLTAWKQTVPPARWLRGTMMALLASVPPPPPVDWWALEVEECRAGYRWLQAWFSGHLEELEQRNSVHESADESWLLEECPF